MKMNSLIRWRGQAHIVWFYLFIYLFCCCLLLLSMCGIWIIRLHIRFHHNAIWLYEMCVIFCHQNVDGKCHSFITIIISIYSCKWFLGIELECYGAMRTICMSGCDAAEICLFPIFYFIMFCVRLHILSDGSLDLSHTHTHKSNQITSDFWGYECAISRSYSFIHSSLAFKSIHIYIYLLLCIRTIHAFRSYCYGVRCPFGSGSGSGDGDGHNHSRQAHHYFAVIFQKLNYCLQ